MLRDAREGDDVAIEAFLSRHADTSMFLRANLRQFGLALSHDRRATRFWLDEMGGDIGAVFGLSNSGFVSMQAPGGAAPRFEVFAARLNGERLAGITGETAQVEALKEALGLAPGDFSLFRAEPLYRLPLARMSLPEGQSVLRKPVEADRALLEEWVFAYDIEALGAAPDAKTRSRVADLVGRILAEGHTRVLTDGGVPVAKTAFNARLPDMVQIGGVYTPPGLRGRGYARRAVALHLDEARREGIETAILFASGPAACRAYEAIGFRRIGLYSLAILKEPVVVGEMS